MAFPLHSHGMRGGKNGETPRSMAMERGAVFYLFRRAISWRLGPVDTMVMGTPMCFSKNST